MYEALKPLGIISIAIGWASMLFLIYKWRGDKSMSFSRHAAAHRNAYLFMAIMESIFLPMYLIFIATWFASAFDMPEIFIFLNAVAVIGLIIAAWVPDVAGAKGKIHHIVAYPAYASMILSTPFIIFSDSISNFARIFTLLACLLMIPLGIYMSINPKSKDKFLFAQGFFLASIHLSIVVTTYLG